MKEIGYKRTHIRWANKKFRFTSTENIYLNKSICFGSHSNSQHEKEARQKVYINFRLNSSFPSLRALNAFTLFVVIVLVVVVVVAQITSQTVIISLANFLAVKNEQHYLMWFKEQKNVMLKRVSEEFCYSFFFFIFLRWISINTAFFCTASQSSMLFATQATANVKRVQEHE